MSAQHLAITYSGAAALADPYWIRIEQDSTDETATVSDAADLLDALYDIEACDDTTEDTDAEASGDSLTSGEPTTDLGTAVEETLDLSFCDADADGSVEVEIRIIRSHLAEPYTLRLQGGELVSTVQVAQQVTVTAEISAELTLDYPVVDGFYCTPQPIKRNGSVLRFAASQVGRMMTATYTSKWDVATIKVLGIDGEVGECRALAFHHGVVADVDVEVPDASDADKSLCPSITWQPLSEQNQVTCYKDIIVSQRCTCSETEVGSYTYQQAVPCPDREIKCPGVLTECMHFLGTELVVERVDCADDNQIGGGSLYTYKVSDPDYYRKMCCQEPPGVLPQCPTRRTTYKGELPIEFGEAYWRKIYGENARFVPVPPPGGICGEWVIKQQIASNNCCDGVPPLVWDTSVSPEVMAPNSAVMIGVIGGGKYPYRWEVDGHGFQFQNGSRSIETISNQVRLSALPIACGTAVITCTDGCSTVMGYIRATAGQWVRVYLNTNGGPPLCDFVGDCVADLIAETITTAVYEAMVGPVKLHQVVAVYDANAPAYATAAAAQSACAAAYNALLESKESEACRYDEHKCSTCFVSAQYAPCTQYSDFPSYDPAWKTSCAEHVYGYYGAVGSWWYVKAHYSRVSSTEIWEWRC